MFPADFDKLAEKVCRGDGITFDEAIGLIGLTRNSDIIYLAGLANHIREKFCGLKIDLCSIVNAKSGGCPEDCKFCAQSSSYRTECPAYPLLSKEVILNKAIEAKKIGVKSFCVVTSGRAVNDADFVRILEILKSIKDLGMNPNCSLGFLTEERIKALESVGVKEYNHNIETARSHFSSICTTHKFEDRVETVRMVKCSRLRACCGGIIGMGESQRQRIEMAFSLKELNVDCVTLNILNPRPGTPLEYSPHITPMEIIKTIAVFRFILPKVTIKLAGGREVNLRDLQSLGLSAGANGLIIGGYLTIRGRTPEEDLEMVRDLGFEIG